MLAPLAIRFVWRTTGGATEYNQGAPAAWAACAGREHGELGPVGACRPRAGPPVNRLRPDEALTNTAVCEGLVQRTSKDSKAIRLRAHVPDGLPGLWRSRTPCPLRPIRLAAGCCHVNGGALKSSGRPAANGRGAGMAPVWRGLPQRASVQPLGEARALMSSNGWRDVGHRQPVALRKAYPARGRAHRALLRVPWHAPITRYGRFPHGRGGCWGVWRQMAAPSTWLAAMTQRWS
jgi:hypothetical protein